MKTMLLPIPREWEGEGGLIVHNNPAAPKALGKVTAWQRQSCPYCLGCGAVCCGRGKYGDSKNAQHVPVYRKCADCGGSGQVMLADYYDKGEYRDTPSVPILFTKPAKVNP